ncbi:type III pantothenate kinase [Salinimicrobium tongyeongense]|uniref:Type III pantothenate kinase n=1 Tax=Salinimicrobium tongyeongense TaxID=2809707 RepID=A0ABY6NMZ1_9FLAO|nr:type III pantothenate kinase [Salinimicrobium tongyeongense]UZH54218.1 type III pantothenate kinase [Salinimicrobium tongyeongense]
MNLVVDIGNTIAKLAVFQQDEIIKKTSAGKSDLNKKISEFLKLHPQIRNLVVSNVSSVKWELPEGAEKSVRVLELSAETFLPFKNSYGTPATLGNDRKALIAAAVKQYAGENVLVIDAGTCITYDFKTAREEYLGGAISPGLKMRFLALNNFTSNLPLVEAGEGHELIGDSTTSSISSGVVNGTLMEIEGIIGKYKEKYANLICIITGGDATFLSGNLKNGIFANSNFLLEGLNFILEFNIDQ